MPNKNNPKYTLGPWKIQEEDDDVLSIRASGKLDAVVAQIELNSELCTTADEVEPNQQRHNAYLIAAAPDTFDILSALVMFGMLDHNPVAKRDVKKVLAKAGGQSEIKGG